MFKLNFGSANDKLGDGWKNVDALEWSGNTDIIWDMNTFPYPFEDGSADEIRSVENLEHLSWRITDAVLAEFYRILKKGGGIYVQVPDAGKAMEYYVHNQICECVPHKVVKGKDFVADPDCMKCDGAAKINPNRWLFTFTGAQKHKFDVHLNIFTKDLIEEYLTRAGFEQLEFVPDIYKLKVKAKKI